MKYLHMLLCLWRGHIYRPSYYHQFTQEAWYLPRKNQTFTYECDDCKRKVTIKGKKAHEEFQRTHKPTWGDRGSDSQGYNEE